MKPYSYGFQDNEASLIIPAIEGVRSVLEASQDTSVNRIVMTSSFGSVLDMGRDENTPWTYSEKDWNPITYAEAAAPDATAQDAYRGSKTFAEQEAWSFVKEKRPQFDLVTLCPSMIFGPLASQPSSIGDLNESNMMLWKVATGGQDAMLPPCRFNFWIDVRDLAEIHVQALLSPIAGGKRYLPVSPEPFTYQKASEVMIERFPSLGKNIVTGTQDVKTHVQVDTMPVEKDFPGIRYTPFKDTVFDLMAQLESFA